MKVEPLGEVCVTDDQTRTSSVHVPEDEAVAQFTGDLGCDIVAVNRSVRGVPQRPILGPRLFASTVF